MKKILLTGGGTAGHVTPNIALLGELKRKGFDIEYVGSETGIEKELAKHYELNYHGVSAGKLRRYFSPKNFTDMFRVIKGLSDANKIVKDIKPDILFSKGGFVSVPVVVACKLNKVPVIIHESDMTLGLANRIASAFSDKICVTFPETLKHVPGKKAVLTGTPIREELFLGSKIRGKKICGFSADKPTALVMGGSQGSAVINKCVRAALPKLLLQFNIIHLCGKNNIDKSINDISYKQYEYVTKDLPHLLALSNLVVSRAGSNSINEFLALNKPNLLIPLSKKASRGDQIMNAESFVKQGFSEMISEEELTEDLLIESIKHLFNNRGKYVTNMEKSVLNNGVAEVIKLICEITGD